MTLNKSPIHIIGVAEGFSQNFAYSARNVLRCRMIGARSTALKKWATCLSTTLRGGMLADICSLERHATPDRSEVFVADNPWVDHGSNGVEARLLEASEYSSDKSSFRA